MKIGYILAGLVFLFNPHIHVIDMFPDVIGYALILHGLSKISDLERNLTKAKGNFKKLAWLSAGKLACLLILPIFDETLYLIFTFTFGMFEMIWGIPAFIDLFQGIAFLEQRYTKHRTRYVPNSGLRFGGTLDKTDFPDGRVYFEVYGKTHQNADYPADEETVLLPAGRVTVSAAYEGFHARDEKKTPYYYESAEARVMSIIFLIVRALSACLPELTAIASVGDSYVHANPTNDYSGLRYLLEGAFAVLAGVVGIIWLCRMVKYFKIFMNDTPFQATLLERYNSEIAPNRALHVRRATMRFCLFSTVALAFMTCIRLSIGNITNGDGKLLFTLEAAYLIPEFVFGVMMLFAFRGARAYHADIKKGRDLSIAFTAVSAVSYTLLLALSLNFGRTFRPYKEPLFIALFAAYFVVFLVSMALFVMVNREKEKVYRSFVHEIALTLAPDDNDYAIKRRALAEKEFAGKLRAMTVIATAYAVFSVVCMALIPFAEEYALCGLSWFFRSGFCVFFIIKSVLLTDKLQKEIEKVTDLK